MNRKNNDGTTPLHYAVYKGHAATAKSLIENGAKTTISDIRGHSPFDFAKETGNEEILNLFGKEEQDERCFIATACYGSPNCNEVVLLRTFRDNILLKYKPGRHFVDVYYRLSPPVATAIRNRNHLRKSVYYMMISPLVKIITNYLKK